MISLRTLALLLALVVCTPLVCLAQYPFDAQAAADVDAVPQLPLSINISTEVNWLNVNDKQMTIEWVYTYRQNFRDIRLQYNETLYGPSIAWNDGTTRPAAAFPFVPTDIIIRNGIKDEWYKSSTAYVLSPDGGVYLTTLRKTTTFNRMDFTDFPFDVQYCSMEFESWMHDDETFTLGLRISQQTQKGYIYDTFQNNAFDVSFHRADVIKYYSIGTVDKRFAIISITYKLKRYSSFYVNGIVVPSLLLLFLVWLGMFIDRKAAPARTGLLVTCTLTQVALRIPVAAMLPVVDYSTWIGTFQLYSLGLTALGIVEFVIVNFLGQGGDDKVRDFFGSSAPPEVPNAPLLKGDNVPEVQANPLEHKAFDDSVGSSHSPVLLPMQTYCDLFARYDPDQTGSLETEEAFEQLTLTCATRARLNTGDKRVDQEVRKALEQEDCDDFNLLNFIKWFEEAFASGKGNKDDGTQSRGRQQVRRPGSSSKGGSGSGSGAPIEGATGETQQSCFGDMTCFQLAGKCEIVSRWIYVSCSGDMTCFQLAGKCETVSRGIYMILLFVFIVAHMLPEF